MATDDLKALEAQGLDELKAAGDEAALRAWNGKFLGEKGLIRDGAVEAWSDSRRTRRRLTVRSSTA